MNWKDKRVFITGGTGFIGSHLSKRLDDLGATLGFYIHKHESDLMGIRVYGDLGIPQNDLASCLRYFKPEVVFHLAAQPLVQSAMSNEMETLQINVDGTYNLLHACMNLSSLKAIIHVSTDKVYGNHSDAVDEGYRLLGADHPYNASKLCGDIIAQMYAASYGLPIIISRSGNIYGAGDKNLDRLIPGAITATLRGESLVIRSDGKMVRDYIYIDDIIDGYLLLAELASEHKTFHGTAFNFGASKPLSVMDVVHEVLGEMGRVDLFPKIENTAKLEIPYQHLNWFRARYYGWSPKVDIKKGIQKTIPWYRSEYEKS